jgi:hypothetical protein
MWLRISLVVLLLAGRVCAQSETRYYVRDEVKAPDLDYTVDRDVVVRDSANPAEAPSLFVRYSTNVLGSTRRSFRYADEMYNEKITREQAGELTAAIKQADLEQLRKTGATTCQTGILVIEGQDHDFNNPIGDPARDKLQAAVLEAVDKIVPRRKREITAHIVEGDLQEVRGVTVEKLLAHPAKYDGKRVTITGYFVDEFENSNLSDQKGAGANKSIWLEGPSTFARKGDIQWTDEGRVIVDGVFMRGSGGHMGAWDGELQRVTRMVCLDPQPVSLPGNYESSKRR